MINFIFSERKAKWSLMFLGAMIVASVLIPLFPFDPNYFDPNYVTDPIPPSSAHIFGTDDLGRDLFLRMIYGARVSLFVGVISVLISLVVGVTTGLLSGYIGGRFDSVMMRLVDLFMAIPTLFLILTIQVILTPSLTNVMVVIGLTSWMGMCRLVRAEMLSLKEQSFVVALKARGIPPIRVLFKHIFPHALNPIIVAAMMGMGGAILTESVLSFLGLGVQPPFASWGNMLDNSLSYMWEAPWMVAVPGICISLTVLSLNFIGDQMRSYFNPQEHVKR